MKKSSSNAAFAAPAREVDAPRYRSGAVAHMLGMPVATLRIWERRYAVAAPATTSSGHRLYSGADVQRLSCIRRLTGLGHAIGALAPLGTPELLRMAALHQDTRAAAPSGRPTGPRLRVGVVGDALAARVGRAGFLAQPGGQAVVAACFDTAQQAASAIRRGAAVDVLLLQLAGLQASGLAPLRALVRALGDRRLAVTYGFASTRVLEVLAASGVALCREPVDDRELATWLGGLGPTPAPAAIGREPLPEAPPQSSGVAAPRYDDAALTAFAGQATRLACECPRHVADLLMQLAHFEAYSAQCASENAADARMHAYLSQVTGGARMMLEGALEALARHEGLRLPSHRRAG